MVVQNFDEFELKILQITRDYFSDESIQDEMKFYREKGLTFELGFFRNKLIYALYKSGINADVKGTKKQDCDVLIYRNNDKNIKLELKVTRKGTLSWLIKDGLERHHRANLYLFMVWRYIPEEKFTKLRNYLEKYGYLCDSKNTRDWVYIMIKRK